MSTPLPAITITPGNTFTVPLATPFRTRALLITNKSFYVIQVSGINLFYNKWLSAGTEGLFLANGHDGINGVNGQVSLAVFNNINLNNPPASVVLVTAFLDTDPLPKGSWPVTVPFQTSVSQVVSATSAIKNDGSVAGTSIMEATVSGDASSAVTLTNDAVMVLGDSLHPGSLTLFGLLTNNNSLVLAGATSGTLTITVLCKFPIILLGQYTNFRNGGATDQFLTLPVAFNAGLALAIIGDDVP